MNIIIIHLSWRRNFLIEVLLNLTRSLLYSPTVIRGEKTRRIYSGLLQRNRAAIVIQRNTKRRAAQRDFVDLRCASIVIQSGNSVYIFSLLGILVYEII